MAEDDVPPHPVFVLRMEIFDQLPPDIQERIRFGNEGIDTLGMQYYSLEAIRQVLESQDPSSNHRTKRVEDEFYQPKPRNRRP